MQLLDVGEWCRAQERMAAQAEGDEPDGPPAPVTFRLVGGLDISPVPLAAPAEGGRGGPAGGGAGELAVASLVVLALPALRPVYEDDVQVRLTSPYVAGFLGFREVPAYQQLLARAADRGVRPDLLLVDGCGRLHPRRCGAATHLGLVAGIPTVGVAKRLLHVEGLDEARVRGEVRAQQAQQAHRAGGAAEQHAGARVPLRSCAGEVLGAAVCSPGTRRPVYVSVGHGVSLEAAVVLACCRHRVPEPIRLADLRSRRAAHLLGQMAEAGAAA